MLRPSPELSRQQKRGPRKDPALSAHSQWLVGNVEAHHDRARTTDGSSGGAKVGGIVRTVVGRAGAGIGVITNRQGEDRAQALRRVQRERQRKLEVLSRARRVRNLVQIDQGRLLIR